MSASITRDLLASFLPNERLIRAFEDLISQVTVTIPAASLDNESIARLALALAAQALAQSDDREDNLIIPGPKGDQGAPGAPGPMFFVEDGADGDMGLPGNIGPALVVTGSRGGNAALASLLTALAQKNLVIDNSTP